MDPLLTPMILTISIQGFISIISQIQHSRCTSINLGCMSCERKVPANQEPVHEFENNNKIYKVKVVKLMDFGAFCELEAGLTTLLHSSELSWTKKNVHPNAILNVNDEVNVKILEVDLEKRRISLGLKQCLDNPWEKFKKNYKIDQVISGKIKNLTEFGIFIELPDELDGMVVTTPTKQT